MRKIVIILLLLANFYVPKVEAKSATLEEEYLKGVYYIQEKPSGEKLIHQQAIFRLEGKIAYCLTPDIPANPGEYMITEGLNGSYLLTEEKTLVEAFGYYGYEYPNHQTVNYYLATQELIWEFVSDYEVSWSTRGDQYGIEISVEKEKKEILELIDRNKILPSFVDRIIYIYENESIQLEDENQVLQQFQIDDRNVKIDGNQLILENIQESKTIKGSKILYDHEVTLLYRQQNSQKLATLRLSEPATFELKIEVEGNCIEIQKYGEVRESIFDKGTFEFQNDIEFNVYVDRDIYGHDGQILYKSGFLIDCITTMNGIAHTKLLPYGEYRIVETRPKMGYQLAEPMLVVINSSVEKNKIIEIKNYLSTGSIKIQKTNMNGNALAGITFGLYDIEGKKITENVTDANGIIVWKNIPVGIYVVKEVGTIEGYQLNEKIELVEINESEETIVNFINVPLLPNTRNHQGRNLQWLFSLCGFLISKKLLLQ